MTGLSICSFFVFYLIIILVISSMPYPKLAQRRTWYTHGSRRGEKKKKWENGSESKGPDRVEQRLHVYIPIESGSVQSVRNFWYLILFFIKLWNLGPLGTGVIFRRGSIDLILPPTVTTSDSNCFNWRPHPLLVLSLFFFFFNFSMHTSSFFLYNFLVSLWHSSYLVLYFNS